MPSQLPRVDPVRLRHGPIDHRQLHAAPRPLNIRIPGLPRPPPRQLLLHLLDKPLAPQGMPRTLHQALQQLVVFRHHGMGVRAIPPPGLLPTPSVVLQDRVVDPRRHRPAPHVVRVAAPRVLLQHPDPLLRRLLPGRLRLDRVQVHIPRQRQQVLVRLHHPRLVPPPERVPRPGVLVPVVEAVTAVQPLHAPPQVRPRRPHHQVIVIRHQHPGIQDHPVLLQVALQLIKKPAAVAVVVKDDLPGVAPAGHVVQRVLELHPRRSGHNAPVYPNPPQPVNSKCIVTA